MKLFELKGIDENQEIIAAIKRDCQPFLKAAKGWTLYRGMNADEHLTRTIYSNSYIDFKIGSVRNNRKAKDSNPKIHDMLNDYFIEKTGIPVRSACLFTSGKTDTASIYGKIAAIFPIGEFHYAWSPYVIDAYGSFQRGYLSTDLEKIVIAEMDKIKELSKTSFSNLNLTQKALLFKNVLANNDIYKFDQDLQAGIRIGNEIMVVCDKYYALVLKNNSSNVSPFSGYTSKL